MNNAIKGGVGLEKNIKWGVPERAEGWGFFLKKKGARHTTAPELC